MASNAEWSLGDYVEMGDGATPIEAFSRIPEMRVISPDFGIRERVDTSSHDSTKPFRDDVATFLGQGTITLEGNYLPLNAIQKAVETARSDDVKKNFRLNIVDDDGDPVVIYAGQARVLSFNPVSNFEDARRVTITLGMTGAWPRVMGS